MNRMTALLVVSFGLALCAGCNSDSGKGIPPTARDPFANRIDPENPPPPDPPAPKQAEVMPMPKQSEVGIAFYPNAQPYKDELGTEASHVRGEGMLTVMLETTDPIEKVVNFYQKKMVKADRTDETEGGKRVINFSEAYSGNGVRMASISEVGDKTRITLQNVRPTRTAADPLTQGNPTGIGTPGINPAPSSPSSGSTTP